jgi:antitoxin component YwqK of YwqJK toxin-antitoxin module
MLQKIYSNTAGISSTYLPPFKNCVHHGTYINYHQNGAVKDSGFYVNGLKHGLWRESVNSDSMYTFGSYNHGLRNTQWKYYDNGDRLIYTEYYKKNGEIRGRHYFERSSPSL